MKIVNYKDIISRDVPDFKGHKKDKPKKQEKGKKK